MNRMHHHQSEEDQTIHPHEKRGILSIIHCVQTEEKELLRYIQNSGERHFRMTREEKIISEVFEYEVSVKKIKKAESQHLWKVKRLHANFLRDTEEVTSEET